MPQEVIITTGARLHFGLLANRPRAGRDFGGAGLMIEQPGLRLMARGLGRGSDAAYGGARGDQHSQNGLGKTIQNRVEEFAARYRARCPADVLPPACRIEVLEGIPPHIGLGSGTQLGLAVARALACLAGDDSADAATLAQRVGRGKRSALGIHGFAQGGFLVESGKLQADQISPLVARTDFPSEWRLVLVTPPQVAGVSGTTELEAFAKLAPLPETVTERLCRILLMELLPAVVEHRFDACGDALYDFGYTVGEYFAPVQGGAFSNPRMKELVQVLRARGIRGVGQTSWGPTLFALCEQASLAESLRHDLEGDSNWGDCTVRVTKAKNLGAHVTVCGDMPQAE